jgi:hypothetical protein
MDGVGKGYMEENCGGGQGLNWAVEPTGEREGERLTPQQCELQLCNFKFEAKGWNKFLCCCIVKSTYN